MSYSLRFSNRARKHIRNLYPEMKERVIERLEQLCGDPYNVGISEALTGKLNTRKSRVGGRRIVFEVDRGNRTIDVLAVQPRGQVYKRI